ncbi:MAG: magnesium/cobalt transporter CorA [Acidobacteriia bacterium]|nr:magnesium/cobalt transporter CorA [Terriglobia bacterium]
MIWHDLRDPNDGELDILAERHHLHSLHIEDCRHGNQRAKVEEGADYIFAVVKPVHVTDSGELLITDLDLFLGRDYVITVQEGDCPAVRMSLDQLHTTAEHLRPDQLFYKVADGVVDAYAPALDWFNETIDRLEDAVLEKPSPSTLQTIFETKRGLIELRRALGNMRDVAGHLQRLDTDLIQRDLWPFLRDVYDHLARNMDMVEMQRDLLTGAMDIYLSSVANRTNQVMKVLTVLGTVALPAIVISGLYGMNTKGLPWVDLPYGSEIALGLMAAATVILLIALKKLDWL